MTSRSQVPSGVKREPEKHPEGSKKDKAMTFKKRDARRWRPPQNHGRGKANTNKVGSKKGVHHRK